MTGYALIAAAKRLTHVLEQENGALRIMDLTRAASLLTEKTAALETMRAAGGLSSEALDPAIMAAARHLDNVLKENRQLLERAIMAQQRVIGIIVRSAAGARATTPAYGARGRRCGMARPLALSTRA